MKLITKTTAPNRPAFLGLVKKTMLKKEAQARIFAKTKAIKWAIVAGVGFEPTASRLWASRATRLLYPALKL